MHKLWTTTRKQTRELSGIWQEELKLWKDKPLREEMPSEARSQHKQQLRHMKEIGSSTDESDFDEQLSYLTTQPAAENTSTEDVHSLTSRAYQKKKFATMQVGMSRDKRQTRFQVDTGAKCNVVRLGDLPANTKIEPTKQTFSMFNSNTLVPRGQCQLRLKNPKDEKRYKGSFIVVQEAPTSILGASTVQYMGLIKIRNSKIYSVKQEDPPQPTASGDHEQGNIAVAYRDVFEGEVGRFDGVVHLDVDPSMTPKPLPLRRVPVAMKTPLKKELECLERAGIIDKVDHPTDWVSHLITVKKPDGSLRLCLDPQPLNRALTRRHFPIQTLDDLLPELTKARVYSVTDVRHGFGM